MVLQGLSNQVLDLTWNWNVGKHWYVAFLVVMVEGATICLILTITVNQTEIFDFLKQDKANLSKNIFLFLFHMHCRFTCIYVYIKVLDHLELEQLIVVS